MPIQRGVMRTKDNSPVLSSDVEETVSMHFPDVTFIIADKNCQNGTLYLTTKRLIWLSEDIESTQNSFAIDYYSINLHAISRDTATYPKPCIYCQLAGDPSIFEEVKVPNEDDYDEDEEKAFELLLIPKQPNDLELIFKTMSDLSALNPNPEDEQDEEDEEDEADEDEEDEKNNWIPDGVEDVIEDAVED